MTTKAGVSESLEFPLIGSALEGHGAVSVCFRSQLYYLYFVIYFILVCVLVYATAHLSRSQDQDGKNDVILT